MNTERLSLIPEPFLKCDVHITADGQLQVVRKDGGIQLTISREGAPTWTYLPDEDVEYDIVRSGHDPRETFTVVEE